MASSLGFTGSTGEFVLKDKENVANFLTGFTDFGSTYTDFSLEIEKIGTGLTFLIKHLDADGNIVRSGTSIIADQTGSTHFEFELDTLLARGGVADFFNGTVYDLYLEKIVPNEVSQNNLISYWKLDDASGNALDSHGSNDGTLSGTTQGVTGKINNAYDFNGSTDHINIDNVITDVSGTTQGTWACWVKPVDATPATSEIFLSFARISGTGNDNLTINIRTTGEFGGSAVENGFNLWSLATDSPVFSDNTWTHIAIVHDGISPVIYVDGVAVDQTFSIDANKAAWFLTIQNIDNGRIGSRNLAGESFWFNGTIDEVGIWTRALTPVEITNLYNDGLGLTYPFKSVKYHWNMGEGGGKFIHDDESSNTGTVSATQDLTTAWATKQNSHFRNLVKPFKRVTYGIGAVWENVSPSFFYNTEQNVIGYEFEIYPTDTLVGLAQIDIPSFTNIGWSYSSNTLNFRSNDVNYKTLDLGVTQQTNQHRIIAIVDFTGDTINISRNGDPYTAMTSGVTITGLTVTGQTSHKVGYEGTGSTTYTGYIFKYRYYDFGGVPTTGQTEALRLAGFGIEVPSGVTDNLVIDIDFGETDKDTGDVINKLNDEAFSVISGTSQIANIPPGSFTAFTGTQFLNKNEVQNWEGDFNQNPSGSPELIQLGVSAGTVFDFRDIIAIDSGIVTRQFDGITFKDRTLYENFSDLTQQEQFQITSVHQAIEVETKTFFDAVAQAGATLTFTERNGINQLVRELKQSGDWLQLTAIYPMVGATSGSCAINLKTPGTFDIIWNGLELERDVSPDRFTSLGWTSSAAGYGDTQLIPFPNFKGKYSISSEGAELVMGAYLLEENRGLISTTRTMLGIREGSGTGEPAHAIEFIAANPQVNFRTRTNGSVTDRVQVNISATTGFIYGDAIHASVARVYHNGVFVGSDSFVNVSRPAYSIHMGGLSTAGVNGSRYWNTYSFALLGDKRLADPQGVYNIVQNFHTRLNKKLETETHLFSDAVIASGGTLSGNERIAVNNLVLELKDEGLWDKMVAIYPMVGASSGSCSINLKTPGTYTIGWVNTVAGDFTASGWTPNGTTSYGNANIQSNTEGMQDDSHLSYYSRTDTSLTSVHFWGREATTSQRLGFSVIAATSLRSLMYDGGGGKYNATFDGDTRGFFLNSRTSPTNSAIYKNDTNLISVTTGGGTIPNGIFLGAWQGSFVDRYIDTECAFASIGFGLTDQNVIDFYNAVQTFNTTLNREV